jgi:hypothetical protein
MTISGFLPQRWRSTPEAARHAEAIAGVLHTPPIERTAGGPAVVSLLGTAEVLAYLVAIKSLRHRLRRGSVAIVDDGTLTGEDRAILAHHCGDPEIVPHQAVRRGPFPAGGEWAALLTVLDRRAGQYWIALDPRTVTLGELPEIEAAIASNRSFALTGGEAKSGPARRAERRLAVVCGTRGWRYRAGCHGLAGFAAGGTGRALAGALCSELSALGESATAETARNLVLANEIDPVLLPKARYGRASAGPNTAFVHFPDGPQHGEAYADAGRRAIAQLLG